MRRAPGWSILAGTALELAVWAFISRAMELANGDRGASHPELVVGHPEPVVGHPEPVEGPRAERAADDEAGARVSQPLEFVKQLADDRARYYRAFDEGVELYAGVFSDGRIRLADSGDRRFAGAVVNGRADVLDLSSQEWSEVFVRVNPAGEMQLELRGGPYGARVLKCEVLSW